MSSGVIMSEDTTGLSECAQERSSRFNDGDGGDLTLIRVGIGIIVVVARITPEPMTKQLPGRLSASM